MFTVKFGDVRDHFTHCNVAKFMIIIEILEISDSFYLILPH